MGESSKALLNLSHWLKEDSKSFESVYPEMESSRSDIATLTQLLQMESMTQGTKDSLQKQIPVSHATTETDLVLGKLLRLAVIQDPGFAKARNELADWSYQMGGRVLEQSSFNDNRTELTSDEIRVLESVLPVAMIGDQKRKSVESVISQISLKDSHLAGHEYEKWDFMRRELMETGVLDNVGDNTIHWWQSGKQSSEGSTLTMTCQLTHISSTSTWLASLRCQVQHLPPSDCSTLLSTIHWSFMRCSSLVWSAHPVLSGQASSHSCSAGSTIPSPLSSRESLIFLSGSVTPFHI